AVTVIVLFIAVPPMRESSAPEVPFPMTASVNLLTDRARRPAAKAPPTPMHPVSDLRVFLEAFGRLGYDVEDLRGAAGLSAEQLSDPDGLAPGTTTPALFC